VAVEVWGQAVRIEIDAYGDVAWTMIDSFVHLEVTWCQIVGGGSEGRAQEGFAQLKVHSICRFYCFQSFCCLDE